jgi:hypothetical protein
VFIIEPGYAATSPAHDLRLTATLYGFGRFAETVSKGDEPLIACTFPIAQVAAGIPAFSMRAGPGWTMHGLPTGHWPMLSRSKELAELLSEA